MAKTELEKYFATLAQIQAHYFCLNRLMTEKKKNASPLEMAIDIATGFSTAKNIENTQVALIWLKKIIKLKKKINLSHEVETQCIEKLSQYLIKLEKNT